MSKNNTISPKPLKPFVKVLRSLRNIDSPIPTSTFELQFRNRSNKLQSINIPASLTAHTTGIRDRLLDVGAFLPQGKAAIDLIETALKPVFDPALPLPTVDQTAKTGWHDDSVVLPDITVGRKKGQLEFAGHGEGAKIVLSSSGSLDQWKADLAAPCASSSVLAFTIAAAFAACLLPFAKLSEGAIFLLAGESSSGKTLSCRAAMSVYRAAAGSDVADFNLTNTYLEELCYAHNDMLVVVDEVGLAGDTREEREAMLSRIAYSVPSGKGKKRSAKVQAQGLPNLTYQTLVLCTTEESLKNSDTALKRKTGQEVRLIEIPIPAKKSGGIFANNKLESDDLMKDSAKLAKSVEMLIEKSYGVAIRPYLEHLVSDRAELAKVVEDMTREFIADAEVGSDSAAIRIAKKFALVCAGGRLAAQYGVAPWSDNRIRTACKILFKRTIKLYGRETVKFMTTKSFAQALCGKLDAAPKSFPRVEKGKSVPQIPAEALYGVLRTLSRRDCVLIPRDRMTMLIGSKEIPRVVLDALQKAGALPSASANSATTQVTVMGWPCATKRPGFYVFPLEKLRAIAAGAPG